MALEELLAEIGRQAQAKAAAVVAAAATEAARRRTAEEERLAAERAAAMDACRRELAAAAERRLVEARRTLARELLAARAGTLERVFGAAEARLAAVVDRGDATAALAALLEAALELLGPADGRVRCSPPLARWVDERLAGRTGLAVEPDPALTTGLEVISEDGAVRVDATLSGLLAQLRPGLAIEVARHLGEPP